MDNLSETTPPSGQPDASPDLTGQTLGDFRLLRKLGQGGMGQVYLAEQVSLGRKVAIKLLRADLAANESALKRFQIEAKSVARAVHANIVQVYTVGEANGFHYMALEYVEGRNLRDYLARKGPPELLTALSIMRQVASALHRASELGIIHRDIKPENILLTRKGEVKVADFGLSRWREGDQPSPSITQSGVTMGTPLYMSPEQVEGKPLDCRTDIYSFGVTCYHMLAGETPFRGATAFEVALQHVRDEPPPLASLRPDLPPELCAIVHKMMAKDPAQRYQTGRELLKDLNQLRGSLVGTTSAVPLSTTGFIEPPVGAATTMAPPPVVTASTHVMPPTRSRWRGALVLLALLLSVGAAGAAGAFFGWMYQKDQVPGTEEERAAVEPAPADEALGAEQREQAKKKLIDQYLNPANNFENPATGVRLCLDYALPLLEQDRLDEAEELFKRLEGIQKPEQYHALGLMGRGIVFALRDDFRQSNAAFRALWDRRRRLGDQWVRMMADLRNAHPQLSKWLAEAAHRNNVNSQGRDVAPFLQQFLKKPARPGELPRDKPGPKS